MEEIIDQIAVTAEDKKLIGKVLRMLPTDVETTLFRQEIFADFLGDEKLCEELESTIGKLDILKE